MKDKTPDHADSRDGRTDMREPIRARLFVVCLAVFSVFFAGCGWAGVTMPSAEEAREARTAVVAARLDLDAANLATDQAEVDAMIGWTECDSFACMTDMNDHFDIFSEAALAEDRAHHEFKKAGWEWLAVLEPFEAVSASECSGCGHYYDTAARWLYELDAFRIARHNANLASMEMLWCETLTCYNQSLDSLKANEWRLLEEAAEQFNAAVEQFNDADAALFEEQMQDR